MDRYEEALSRAKKELQNCDPDDYHLIMKLFPELEENIRKSCIRFLETQKQHLASSFDSEIDECINWLKGCYPNPKFKIGDWVNKNSYKDVLHIVKVTNVHYIVERQKDGNKYKSDMKSLDENSHLWSIEDAEPGDILLSERSIFIFKEEYIAGKPEAYCGIMNGLFVAKPKGCWTNGKFWPATKEQRSLLFEEIKKAGYMWDPENLELKALEKHLEPKFQVGDVMRTHKEAEDNLTDGMPVVCSVDGEYYHCNNELIAIKDQDNYEFPPINRKPKPSGWTKEDEENLAYIVGALDAYNSFRETRGNFSGQEKLDAAITWLKNLRKTASSENS